MYQMRTNPWLKSPLKLANNQRSLEEKVKKITKRMVKKTVKVTR